MKRSTVISLLAIMAVKALACAIPGTHNYYLFSVVDQKQLASDYDRRTMDNWRSYAGRDDLYWFDADVLQQVAREKGDALMASYIDHLQRYIEVAEMTRDTWNYPSKQELARRQKELATVQQYAHSKTRTRLRSQHGLLYMRCCMMLGQHQKNVEFWEQSASQYINSVYRDMMRNIYAGALLKTGRTDEATQIFMEQGDVASLYTYYYKQRSYQAIRAAYEHNPNSPAMPFLLQDFANNAQEACDALNEGNMPGKLFIRDIKKDEARQMCRLARQAVNDGKTTNPALWKSLEAWLQYLFFDKKLAMECATEAVTLDGLPRIKDNARSLRLFITASEHKADASLDDFLAKELSWLSDKAKEERGTTAEFYANHYTRVYDRLVHQVLVPKYTKAGRHVEAIAFLAVCDEQAKVFEMLTDNQQANGTKRYTYDGWNMDYSDDFFCHIDTIDVAQAESYLAYTQRQPQTPLDLWLSPRLRHDDMFFHELIGTKYLRLGRWQEAEQHLRRVDVDFVNGMNIAPFMAQRDYRVAPWLNRQRIKSEMQMPGKARTKTNQKLDFVRDMMALEQGYATLRADLRPQRAYDLAVRYMQASFAGDAWYLTRYGKSIMDKRRADEMDMLAQADKLLQTALQSADLRQQELALFARAYLPIDSWYEEEWNDKKVDYDRIVKPASHQYKALLALTDFLDKGNATPSTFVSRCDVLKEFVKQRRIK